MAKRPSDSFRFHGSRYSHGSAHGIQLKKAYGQHFLRDQSVIDKMLDRVTLTPQTSVFEIGCGDGFLTKSILQTPVERVWVFEIDSEWAHYVRTQFPDQRMTIFEDNILQVDTQRFEPGPWTLLSNLPYQITFPILRYLFNMRHLLSEGVIMIQEEVAQKLVAGPGDNTIQALFYGYYFELQLLVKIPPGAFYPPPAVNSRLVYFKPRIQLKPIPAESDFWRFVKLCFQQRRRTLKNNLIQAHYDLSILPERFIRARAQELSFNDFIELWNLLRSS